jgi:hypothetical protein
MLLFWVGECMGKKFDVYAIREIDELASLLLEKSE